MILAFDIGNTDVVTGAWDTSGKLLHQWRLPSTPPLPLPDYERNIRSFFMESDIRISQITGLVLSSVVPSLTHPFQRMLETLFGHQVIVVNHEIYSKLPLGIRNPFEIGSDLVANALAAYERHKTTVLIVDFGTALTFTVVGDDGTIEGVSIAPGIKTAIRSLFSHTAQLPEVPLELPDSVLGKNTVHAIQAGTLVGYVEMVKGMIQRFKTELNRDCTVVATGGLSFLIKEQQLFDEVDVHLTLDGLRLIFDYCTKKNSP